MDDDANYSVVNSKNKKKKVSEIDPSYRESDSLVGYTSIPKCSIFN
jgi:hypothetical protein